MDGATADEVIGRLTQDDGDPYEERWKDPTLVATTEWRSGAIDSLADPEVGSDGTVLVELELNQPHKYFYGIVRVDDRGVWYSDGDGHVDNPAWRLRLLPWRHIEGLTLHQAS